MTAELPVAVLCASIVLDEQIAPLQWTGIVIMLLAIVWMQLRVNRS